MSIIEHPFRVIVVGASVAGLTASHCLHNAGIEHVVLERRSEIAPPEGASIAIYPHGARILHQLGCLEAVKKLCTPCDRWFSRRPDGKAIMNNGFFHHVKEKYGIPYYFYECFCLLFGSLAIIILARGLRSLWLTPILICYSHGHSILLRERRVFLQVLYDCLQDKTCIRTGRPVREVIQSVSGVEVKLEDGTIVTGDMVLGCDGVHSLVRTAMWDHASITAAGLITAKEKTSKSVFLMFSSSSKLFVSKSLAKTSTKPSKRTGNASLA